jgi:hypothetical protein
MKTVWLTSLDAAQEPVQHLMTVMKPYGVEVKGHFWEDDLKKMAWSAVRPELIDPKVALWLILTSSEKLASPSVRYGLSLLTATVQAQRGLSFPVMVLASQEGLPPSQTFPTLLRGFDFLNAKDPALAAKIVAKIHTPIPAINPEYRMDVYGSGQIGQWFEVGPREIPWNGAMFGVAGGEITFHAVGPKGKLPEQATLEYPSKGIKLALGETEYTAWAVQNEMGPDGSYFVRVDGYPDSILFGPYSSGGDAELYVMQLN